MSLAAEYCEDYVGGMRERVCLFVIILHSAAGAHGISNPLSPELPRSSVGRGHKATNPPTSLLGKVVPPTSRYSQEGTRPLTPQAHPHEGEGEWEEDAEVR